MKTWFTCALVVLVAGAIAWPRSGGIVTGAAPAATQVNAPVQIVPGGTRHAGKPGEKGATYYAIEAQATRLTTRFRDGHVAVTERSLVGGVNTTLRDGGGNERGRLKLNRIDSGHDIVHFEPASGAAFQAASDPGVVKPTLDWVTRQAYTLSKDGTDDLVWDAGVMHPKKAARREVESDIDEVETAWANGVVARLTRQEYPRTQIAPGRFVGGPTLVSDLSQNGVSVGKGVWFERDRVFAYTLPGLVPGLTVIGAQELKNNYGGWPFTPDTTWLNLQIIAAHHFATLTQKQGFVAKSCEPTPPSRIAQFFMPTLQANEAGCDGLHWLDGTMFRACCDDHDRCYEKRGCNSSTWWKVWTSWTCDLCNMVVVGCFAAGASDDRCIQRGWCG